MSTLSIDETVQHPPKARVVPDLTPRERELGAIIRAYNEVTEQLKQSHEALNRRVARLHEELAGKNRELQRRERLAGLGELAAGVAHEIRNPLGGIRLFASLLSKDLQDRPDSLRVVEKIVKGVTMLESIVTDILEFGRPPEAVPGRVEMETLVREVVELASPHIEAAGVAIEISGTLAGIELITDGRMLQRAVLNLLFNAVDAAGQRGNQGRVTVTVLESEGDDVQLSIRDNGPGIDGAMLDRVFNPFFTTKDAGTGLGLSIVHQIAESLGGSVRVVSSINEGAEFVMCLPRRLPDRLARNVAGNG